MAESFALTESTYYILLALWKPNHGYGIMQQVEEMSKGRVRLAAGTLYGALNNLVTRGWILPLSGEEGSRKKEYRLTEEGKMILHAEIERLIELLDNGNKVIKGEI